MRVVAHQRLRAFLAGDLLRDQRQDLRWIAVIRSSAAVTAANCSLSLSTPSGASNSERRRNGPGCRNSAVPSNSCGSAGRVVDVGNLVAQFRR